MDIHQTEEQQVEQLKRIWNEYGNAIIAGLVLGFSGFIGYGYYKDNKLSQEIEVSENYQQVITLLEQDDEAFQTRGQDFIKNNSGTSYASLTALALAKDSAEHKDWAQVETYLNQAIENTTNKAMQALAKLRLARVQLETKQIELALKTLNGEFPEAFNAEREEIKGDAYVLNGDKAKARTAYQAALDASSAGTNPVLQMKFDNLAEQIVLPK
ncbi:YfgM family protein [Thalassotalea hakodatensis]|uniref:YfgM family protein n=1 Tax=Thalassotalea hakodatensis TaxID=3030492 RepID=UPI0025734C3F|nr:tetratricopeptide repeat protein [Thalassotalea hakodatensis]